MRPADLWRHSSFRLAVGATLFVLATLMLASGVGYGLMRSHLAERQDARVTEIFAAIEQTSLEGDDTDLVEAIAARILASPDRSTIYLLKDGTGRVLAGNIADVALRNGWDTVPADRLGVVTDYSYRVFSGSAGRYTLTIGLTNADLDDLEEIVFAAFGWAALFALLSTIAMAAFLAVRVQHRLEDAETTVARVAQGDLTARLPISGRGDDLDRISVAINASLARLEGLVAAMRQVSTDIAHDLRTPLNRLRIRIENAATKAGKGMPVEDELAAAMAESDTISETFSALLRIAQIEAGSRREKFAPVDLAALMMDVAEVYAEVAEDAGQTLHCDVAGAAWVRGDRELLTQAIANLIENAIRHCPKGTKINCSAGIAGDTILASVGDTGPGIPEAERDLVLRRLYRLEKSRTTEGTGLGLSLVKAVADLHDASLSLSDAMPGLRVDVRFARIVGAS
jgi:signal transduction histidine kinase